MRGKLGRGELRFDQWHHGYLGLLLIGLGLLLRSHSWAPVISTAGWIVFTDDLFQHVIQWLWDEFYHSPLHTIYAHTIWRWFHSQG